MYFSSRLQAGRMLANQLFVKYRYENCAVLAIDQGGAVVGEQIARELHCVLNMLMTEEILLPREPTAIGGISADGQFVYNSEYSQADLDEMKSEYRGFIEQEKLTKLHEMNRMFGASGLISRDQLKGHNVILVSDGLKNTFSLELALEFLKPINIEKIIVATPLASVQVVDWMHLNANEIYCLSVIEEYLDTDHYYDKRDIPNTNTMIKTIRDIVLNWK